MPKIRIGVQLILDFYFNIMKIDYLSILTVRCRQRGGLLFSISGISGINPLRSIGGRAERCGTSPGSRQGEIAMPQTQFLIAFVVRKPNG